MDERIFLRRDSKIGDIISCEPVFKFLNKNGFNVYFKTSEAGREIYQHCPYIKEIFCNDLNNLIINDYNNVIDLHWIEKGEVIEAIFNGKKLDIHKLNALYLFSISEIFFLKVQQFLKDKNYEVVSNIQPEIHIPLEYEKNFVEKINFLKPLSYIVVHRFSNDTSKNKTENLWTDLITQTLDKGFKVIEIGGKDVELFETEVILKKNRNYYDLRGKLSLLESAVLLKNSYAFLGIISGVSHMANAVKTPSLLISKQYAHFDWHNPYSGFFKDEKNAQILFFKNSYSEIDKELIYKLLNDLLDDRNFDYKKKPYKQNLFAQAKRINDFIKNDEEFIVWGAGEYGKGVKKILDHYEKKLVCFIDSDRKKQGSIIEGVNIISPNENIDLLKTKKTIIASLWWEEIRLFLEELSLKRWTDFI